MIYTSKKECYEDILVGLTSGVIAEEDVRHLKKFYEEIEHYECCQGIIEAFVDYNKFKKNDRGKNKITDRRGTEDRFESEET